MPLIDAISIWLESVGEKVMSKHGSELANSSPLSRHPPQQRQRNVSKLELGLHAQLSKLD